MSRHLLVSAAVGAATAAAFGVGFLLAAPLGVAIAAVLRHIEDNHKTVLTSAVAHAERITADLEAGTDDWD